MKKVNKALSPLYRISHVIPRHILNQIYITLLIYNHTSTTATLYTYDGHLTITVDIRLERLQNRIARLVAGAEFRTSSEALRRDLGWDTLKTGHKLIFYRKLKCEQAFVPQYIISLIPETRQQETGRTLCNSHSHTLPPNRTTSFKRSFVPDTTRLWNILPD